jgi:hypothetical protein
MNRTLVAALRKKLLRRGRALLRGAQTTSARPDLGGLAEAELEELREIHSALERIERGIFGRCETCSAAIDEVRIELKPWERLCAECEGAEAGPDVPGREALPN